MQKNTELSMWIEFFKDASIPSQYAQSYANKFIENRIRFDMLPDLDRSLLNELGISAIGDCISILKYAKTWTPKVPQDPESKESKNKINDKVQENQVENLKNSISSNLSAGMISRLNLDCVKPVNEHSTIEDEESPKKRKLENTEERAKCTTRSISESRGVSSTIQNNDEKTVIRLFNNKRVLLTSEDLTSTRIISINAHKKPDMTSNINKLSSTEKTDKVPQTIKEKTTTDINLPNKTIKKVSSLQSDLIGKSVFDRINMPIKETSKNFQKILSKTPESKISITLNNEAKYAVNNKGSEPIKKISILDQSKKQQKNSTTKLGSVVQTVKQTNQGGKIQRDIFSRISF